MVRVVFQGNAAEKQRYYSGHASPVGEEVASISGESDEARFNGGIHGKGGMLEYEGHCKTEEDTEGHGGTEGEQEDADPMEKGLEVNFCPVELGQRPTEC